MPESRGEKGGGHRPPTDWPVLYKATADGAVNTWRTWVERRTGGVGRIHTEYGREHGKKTHVHEDITEGKNLGRSNETTPFQQAVLEAEAAWKKQLERKGYGETPGASAATRAASPMLAQKYQDRANKIDWPNAFAQPKYDGYRCLASKEVGGTVVLRSREGKPITTMDHVARELGRVMDPGQTLDGELYAHGMEFQQISSAVKRQKTRADHADEVKYHVYDLIAPVRYEHRFEQLRGILARGGFDHLVLATTVMVRTKDELAVCEQEFLEGGYEGAMLRHGREGYEAGKRSPWLLKVKQFHDGEFKVIDVREGRGTHKGMAIFVCQTINGHPFEVTAPGTHAEKRAYWRKHAGYIGRRLTVKYQDFTTTAEAVPRFPVAVRFVDGPRGDDE